MKKRYGVAVRVFHVIFFVESSDTLFRTVRSCIFLRTYSRVPFCQFPLFNLPNLLFLLKRTSVL